MKIMISVDMEGIAGVCHKEQTDPSGIDYQYARRLMTKEANAAIEGALEAGATEIWVVDAHGGNGYRNLLGAELNEAAFLVTGSVRPYGQVEGLDGSFAAIMFVGYHTMHSGSGVLAHTTNGQALDSLKINGVEVGEIGLNAGYAGSLGVPAVLVTGDVQTVAEAQKLIPDLEGAAVKQAISRYAERALHPMRARVLIKEAARQALSRVGKIPPLRFVLPLSFELRFKESATADNTATVPGVTRVDPTTVMFEAPDYSTAYRMYRTLLGLWVPAWGGWIRG